MTLTSADFNASVLDRAFYPGRGTPLGMMYAALGLNGEAGEAAEVIKKMIRDDNGTLSSISKTKILLELGDVLWYVTVLADECGLTLHEVMQANISKLAERAAKTGKGMTAEEKKALPVKKKKVKSA
jgi:NTP pyrophosphatase (non-canonical NTP hydrolase)